MKALVVVGSNCGDREDRVASAISFLRLHGNITAQSGIYESEDCLGTGRKYMNAVLELESALDEEEINSRCKEYERNCGRDQECRKRGEVPVDIDVVVYGEEVRRLMDYNSAYFKKGLDLLQPI